MEGTRAERKVSKYPARFGTGMISLHKKDKPLDPMAIGLLRSSAVMAGAQGFAQTVQEFWFWGSLRSSA